MQMNPVTYGNQFRHEIKFICDLELATGLANYFKRNGFFKNFPDRRVTSIYYDSIDFRCARDNLAGFHPDKNIDCVGMVLKSVNFLD